MNGILNQTSEETIDLATDTDGDGIKDGNEVNYIEELSSKKEINTIVYFEMPSNPNKVDSDNDGILDAIDPKLMFYSMTDRTLALSARLSYTNLKSNIGELVGDKGEKELSKYKIVYANNSGSNSLISNLGESFMDNGLGSVAIKISRSSQRDAIILSFRGTEFDADALNDSLTDLMATALTYKPQSSWVFNDANKLIQGDVFSAAEGLINNYNYKYDLVGDGLGSSDLFKRIGTDIGSWIAKDEYGNVIDAPKVKGTNLVLSQIHGIDLWCKDSRLKYPQTANIY